MSLVVIGVVSCRRRDELVPIPECKAPAGTFARSITLASAPIAALTGDSGRLVFRVLPGDTLKHQMQAIVRVTLLASNVTLAVQRLSPTNLVVASPAGAVGLSVASLGYEAHRDTLMVRAGLADTIAYRLKPACLLLQE